MCGVCQIAFFGSKRNTDREIKDRVSQIMMGEMLISLIPRGRDATGVALAHENKSFAYEKVGWESTKFVSYTQDKKEYPDNWEQFMEHWSTFRSPVVNAIGHVRKETKGSSSNINNCHPIHRGNIVGIHNGNLENDTQVFESLKDKVDARKGDVDSEGIFALMESMGNESDWNKDMVQELCSQITGAFMVMGFNRLFPNKFILFRNEARPGALAIDTNSGVICVASETKHIQEAVAKYNHAATMYFGGKIPRLSFSYHDIPANNGMVIDLAEDIKESIAYEYVKKNAFPVKFLDKKSTVTISDKKTTTTFETKPSTNTQNAYNQNTSFESKEVKPGFQSPAHSLDCSVRKVDDAGDNKNVGTQVLNTLVKSVKDSMYLKTVPLAAGIVAPTSAPAEFTPDKTSDNLIRHEVDEKDIVNINKTFESSKADKDDLEFDDETIEESFDFERKDAIRVLKTLGRQEINPVIRGIVTEQMSLLSTLKNLEGIGNANVAEVLGISNFVFDEGFIRGYVSCVEELQDELVDLDATKAQLHSMAQRIAELSTENTELTKQLTMQNTKNKFLLKSVHEKNQAILVLVQALCWGLKADIKSKDGVLQLKSRLSSLEKKAQIKEGELLKVFIKELKLGAQEKPEEENKEVQQKA